MDRATVRAVIYLPPGVDRAVWTPRCLEHCERRGYAVVAVIDDQDAAWHDVWSMLAGRDADVVVITRWGDLDPARSPRIEEAVDFGDAGADDAGRRPRPAH